MSRQETVDKIARDFDGRACEFCDRYKNSGLSKSSQLLVRFLEEDGLQGRKIADLGCGAGALAIETLRRGAAEALGVDLSPAVVNAANNLAAINHYEHLAKFETGNAATINLPATDIVTLDKVICCYPQAEPLLENAARASTNTIGFVIPRDEGLIKAPLRIGIWMVNLFERFRGGTRFYLHPLEDLDRTLEESGFKLTRNVGYRFWLIFIYKPVQGQQLPGGIPGH